MVFNMATAKLWNYRYIIGALQQTPHNSEENRLFFQNDLLYAILKNGIYLFQLMHALSYQFFKLPI